MNEKPFLAHTHRQGILSDTRSELRLEPTDDHRDRDEFMMWLSIFACCVGAVMAMAWMVFA